MFSYPSTYRSYKEKQDLVDYKRLYENMLPKVKSLRKAINTQDAERNRERRLQERQLSELEEDMKRLEELRKENQRLKEENRALVRVVSKLAK